MFNNNTFFFFLLPCVPLIKGTSQSLSDARIMNSNTNNTNINAGSKDSGASSKEDGNVIFDYSAIRDDLAKLADLIVEHNATEDTMSSRKCARLLQAIRWKLSRYVPY